MPFQSEKQRRFLHANHPEIAKRWERDYANGGISNHFRKRSGYRFGGNPHEATQVSAGASQTSFNGNDDKGGNGANTNPPIVNIHKGPTDAEIEAEKKAIADAEHKAWIDRKDKKKKKVDWVNENLENVDAGFKLKNFATSLNPLDLLKPNLPLVGASYLYNKLKKKKKDNIETSALDVDENIKVAKLSVKQIKEYKALDLKKKMNESGVGPPLTNEEKKELERLEKEKESKLTTDTGTAFVANGGILDIDASEEIISDDGNDIELTAYNAEFDDPNDLSTGVKTLFQAKNGGSYAMQGGVKNYKNSKMISVPKDWKSSPNHPDTELAYITKPEKDLLVKADLHNSLDGSVNKGPEGIISLNGWGDKDEGFADKSHGGGERYSQPTRHHSVDTPDQKVAQKSIDEDKRKAELKNLIETGPGSMEEKYDKQPTYLGEEFEEEYYGPRLAQEKKQILTAKTKEYFERNLKTLDPDKYYEAMSLLEKALEFDLPPTGPIGILMAMYKEHKLTSEGKALLEEWGQFVGGPPGSNPQMYDDLWLALEKRKAKYRYDDDDTKGDGPEVPKVVPIGEEIEEYEGTYAMSPWERIKANQAKRALLVEKGIIQENDESVTDITMEANRGGLANLFRVKNQ